MVLIGYILVLMDMIIVPLTQFVAVGSSHMCSGRVPLVMLEVVSTKGTYGILVPMKTNEQYGALERFR